MNQEITYNSNIIMSFAIIGILIKIFFGNENSPNNGKATSTVWGYGVVSISLIALMFITFSLATKINDKDKGNFFHFIKLLLTQSGPIMATLAIVIWVLALNATYYKKINEQKVSTEYYQFSNINTFLLIMQLSVLFMSLQAGPMQNTMKYTTYFFTIINFIFIGIMNIILRFFTTDG